MKKDTPYSGSFGLKAIPLAVLFFFAALVLCQSAYSQGLMVMAKKISGEVPLTPDSGEWRWASSLEVPLTPQVMAKPRIYESAVKKINVRALHNGKVISFLLEWEDPTEDTAIDIDKFSDAAAMQFPAARAASRPSFAMGDKDNPVNIWFWKAAWQKQQEIQKTYAATDDFAPGVLAGNPVSERKSPVENITAQGFGSATDMGKSSTQNIEGSGEHKSNKWRVVFRRALVSADNFDVSFGEGGVTPIAFAIWNGSEGDRGGRKALSTWYYVGLETEEKKTLFVYPVLALIAAVGCVVLLVLWLKKARA